MRFFGSAGVANETPPFKIGDSNPRLGAVTLPAGQFYWGGILPKSNGGVRRSAQPGLQSGIEYMDICRPNCETHKSIRCESRPK